MFSSAPHIFRKSQTGISNMLSHCISTLPPSGCRRWFLFCCVHISCRLRGNARAIFRTYCHDHYSKAEYYAGALPDGLGIRYDFKGGSKTELGRGSEGGEVENNSPPPHYPLQTGPTVQAALARYGPLQAVPHPASALRKLCPTAAR